jgi:hypothetical protein
MKIYILPLSLNRGPKRKQTYQKKQSNLVFHPIPPVFHVPNEGEQAVCQRGIVFLLAAQLPRTVKLWSDRSMKVDRGQFVCGSIEIKSSNTVAIYEQLGCRNFGLWISPQRHEGHRPQMNTDKQRC